MEEAVVLDEEERVTIDRARGVNVDGGGENGIGA